MMELSICLEVASLMYSSDINWRSSQRPLFKHTYANLAISLRVHITPEPPQDVPSGVLIHQASLENPIGSRSLSLIYSRNGTLLIRSTMVFKMTVAAVS